MDRVLGTHLILTSQMAEGSDSFTVDHDTLMH